MKKLCRTLRHFGIPLLLLLATAKLGREVIRDYYNGEEEK
jgi:hypothetical protein